MDKRAKVLPVCNKLMMIWVENKKFCEFQQYFSAQEFRASHHGGHETQIQKHSQIRPTISATQLISDRRNPKQHIL